MDANWPLIRLQSCPKGYTKDLDKAVSPSETLSRVRTLLSALHLDVLAETRRIDTGRLGIPVYISVCGRDALSCMPTKKQMGKGSSREQAETSAVMELMERFSYFTFWNQLPHCTSLTWEQAEKTFGPHLAPPGVISESVQESLPEKAVRDMLNTTSWLFYPTTDLSTGAAVQLPIDWFRMINEFNGSSAGNTDTESVLQGIAELIERHVCCIIDREKRRCRTIDKASCTDPTLRALLAAFEREGIQLILKDFSLSMPIPTVGAVAWDPRTLNKSSELVFTAGTASSPEKAAIRTVTEIAQLAGDFCTNACYEASGLTKYACLDDITWLLEGDMCSFSDLPDASAPDILEEIRTILRALSPRHVYSIRTSPPNLQLPAHYTIIPGLSFRERDRHQCVGLFVGRKLVDECDTQTAKNGLQCIEGIYGNAHFIPFFYGMLALRDGKIGEAQDFFAKAVPLQPDKDSFAMVSFYRGYCATLQNAHAEAIPFLKDALSAAPDGKEYANLLGVSYFKIGDYAKAKDAFQTVLRIDKGSILDLANLGLCEKHLGEWEAAKGHLSAALELDPTIEFARTHLSELMNAAPKETAQPRTDK